MKFRFDILIFMISPLIIYEYFGAKNYDSLLLKLGVFLAVFFEVLFLSEKKSEDFQNDKGLVSIFLIALIVCVNRYTSQLDSFKTISFFITNLGFSFIMLGVFCRFISKRYLKHFFTHSVWIKPDHKLITSGPYKYVRHPAYLGTFLIMLGVNLGYLSFEGGFLTIIFFLFGFQRIKKEEKQLKENFSNEFSNYASNTKMIFPYIF